MKMKPDIRLAFLIVVFLVLNTGWWAYAQNTYDRATVRVHSEADTSSGPPRSFDEARTGGNGAETGSTTQSDLKKDLSGFLQRFENYLVSETGHLQQVTRDAVNAAGTFLSQALRSTMNEFNSAIDRLQETIGKTAGSSKSK